MNNVTPLHLAVTVGSLETVVVLMNPFLPSTLEEKDSDGNTPLHLACRYNRLDVLQFLLDRGADVTARNERNMTCIDVAIEWEAEDVAKTLVKHQRYVLRELCQRNLSYPSPGGRGVFRISSDGDDRRGQKYFPKISAGLPTKPPNIPGPKINPKISNAEFPSLKNRSRKISLVLVFTRRSPRPGYAGTTKNLQIVLNTPHPPPPPQKKIPTYVSVLSGCP